MRSAVGVLDHWVHIREVDGSSPFAPTLEASAFVAEVLICGLNDVLPGAPSSEAEGVAATSQSSRIADLGNLEVHGSGFEPLGSASLGNV